MEIWAVNKPQKRPETHNKKTHKNFPVDKSLVYDKQTLQKQDMQTMTCMRGQLLLKLFSGFAV